MAKRFRLVVFPLLTKRSAISTVTKSVVSDVVDIFTEELDAAIDKNKLSPSLVL